MANTIRLVDTLNQAGIFKRTYSFQDPVKLPPDGKKTVLMRIPCVQISTRIPNIYDARPFGINFNNTVLRVGTDLVGYQTIILEMGLYIDAAMLNSAINVAISSLGWWLNPFDPGFTLAANNVIDRFVITIDSTKLNPAFGTQFYFDLRETTTSSTLYKTLGFASTFNTTTDGLFSSPNLPIMETQGTTAIVCCSLMPDRIVNELKLPYVAAINFAGYYGMADASWPPGNVSSDTIFYIGNRTILSATMYVLSDLGDPMIFMGGRLSLELLFYL